MLLIRKAEMKDIVTITGIYNYAIANTITTFDTEPKSIEDRMKWFNEHNGKYSIMVAEKDYVVVGWASLSPLYKKKSYDISAELSVYVDRKFRRQGIGKYLMVELLERAKKKGELHSIISRITDNNEASIELHKKVGFQCVGTMKEIGYKFNQYIDVHFYQYFLS